MGWWKIRDTKSGGIDWDHQGPGRLVNAIPSGDTPENYYNGDRPADVLDRAFKDIEDWAAENNIRITKDSLSKAYFKRQGVRYLVTRLELARQSITEEYKTAWHREPYPEELEAVFNFCVNPHFP